MGRPPESAH